MTWQCPLRAADDDVGKQWTSKGECGVKNRPFERMPNGFIERQRAEFYAGSCSTVRYHPVSFGGERRTGKSQRPLDIRLEARRAHRTSQANRLGGRSCKSRTG